MRALSRGALLACFVGACGGGGEPPPVTTPLHIVQVRSAAVLLPGSELLVTATVDASAAPHLEVSAGDVRGLPLGSALREADGLVFRMTADAVRTLGAGPLALELVLVAGDERSEPYALAAELAESLDLSLAEVPSGEVHRNDRALVSGAGLLAPGEGTVTARIVGDFAPDGGGATVPVVAALPVLPAERFDRARGLILLTTELGGLYPGTLDGEITLEASTVGGATATSATLPTTLHFGGPELYAFDPTDVALEQRVSLRGAGFLGDRGDELSLVRLEGTFTPEGGAPVAFGPRELFVSFASGDTVTWVLAAEASAGALVSADFDRARGVFSGTATPLVYSGSEELVGGSLPVDLTLRGVTQVVLLRFLPAFYESLTRFGLAAAGAALERLVADRIEGIYAPYALEVRLEEPADYSENGYAVIEIGGPDPNGLGLFGYDNSPGKDVGNLRLFDAIGGANATTQSDGFPGYGGVFVESFLHWSASPGLPGEPPPSTPEPDPLFDEVFGPVRRDPASLAEIRGEGEATRVAEVARALAALASLVGETAAHELGHSLGLAAPYGASTVYHNPGDREGCLMDTGSARPFGERAEQPGFAETRFCDDAPEYLQAILPR